MRRRQVLGTFIGMAALAALDAACGPAGGGGALPSRRLYRVGYLKGLDLGPCGVEPGDWQAMPWGALRVGVSTRGLARSCPASVIVRTLAERGYRTGENLEVTVASPHIGVQDFSQPAAELVARNVDVIVTVTSLAARAARDATTTIPIVVHNIGDVVENGLVSNLARPGGNITGVAMSSVDMALKRIELLHGAFPRAKRPLLIHAPQPSQIRAAGFAIELARSIGLSPFVIQMNPVDATDAVARAETAIADGADSLVIVGGTPSPAAVLSLVRKFRLPAVFNADAYMDEGGAVNLDTVVDYVAVANYIARILQGTKPGDLPILLPTEFELVINLKAAEALGTPIAPSVIASATRVIR